jgi:hypothetical protein
VTEAEILEHLDRNLARNSELMGEVRVELALSREAAERHAVLYGDQRQYMEDQGQFLRDQISRIDKILEPHRVAMRKVNDSLSELVYEIQDFRKEHQVSMKMHTDAIARIYDRLELGGADA